MLLRRPSIASATRTGGHEAILARRSQDVSIDTGRTPDLGDSHVLEKEEEKHTYKQNTETEASCALGNKVRFDTFYLGVPVE